jgi:hypothetical protein
MAERAAYLIDEMLRRMPVRQWVLTLPYRLGYRMAWEHAFRAVLGVYARHSGWRGSGFAGERGRPDLAGRPPPSLIVPMRMRSLKQRLGAASLDDPLARRVHAPFGSMKFQSRVRLDTAP